MEDIYKKFPSGDCSYEELARYVWPKRIAYLLIEIDKLEQEIKQLKERESQIQAALNLSVPSDHDRVEMLRKIVMEVE